jgi:hypothetical protein
MFHARVLTFAVASEARPARRPAAPAKPAEAAAPAAARRLPQWLGRRRRVLVPREG